MKKKVFLVGIGGIGVSSLAKYLAIHNYEIWGSDQKRNKNIEQLEKDFSLNFLSEHKEENISDDFNFLIYSPAVPENNPERKRARELGIKEYSYPEFLGIISQENFTISVAGTNGKTTTATMIAELLNFFEKSPTVVVGGNMKKFNSNFILGKSDLFLVESCEYKDSFLHLHPNIIILTNITPDHLDYFGTFENYKKVFRDFILRAKGDDKILICNADDENLEEIIQEAQKNNFQIIDYLKYQIEKVTIPGEYNRENARAALALIDYLKLDLEKARRYLANDFQGSGKRFEYLGKTENGLVVYDDYAHNPEALEVLLSAVKEKFPDKKNILVFQPHLFSRTQDFFEDFVKSISAFDIVYLLPIYQARENPDDFSISSKKLFEEILKRNQKTFYCSTFDEAFEKIEKENYGEGFILFTAGAGEADIVGKKLIK